MERKKLLQKSIELCDDIDGIYGFLVRELHAIPEINSDQHENNIKYWNIRRRLNILLSDKLQYDMEGEVEKIQVNNMECAELLYAMEVAEKKRGDIHNRAKKLQKKIRKLTEKIDSSISQLSSVIVDLEMINKKQVEADNLIETAKEYLQEEPKKAQ